MDRENASEGIEFQQPSTMSFIPFKEVCHVRQRSPSSIDNDVIAGTWPPPVKMGGKLKSWPKHEIDYLIAARMAGKSNEEIKELVVSLVEARAHLFKSLSKIFTIAVEEAGVNLIKENPPTPI